MVDEFDEWWERYKRKYGVYPHVASVAVGDKFKCAYCGFAGTRGELKQTSCSVKPNP